MLGLDVEKNHWWSAGIWVGLGQTNFSISALGVCMTDVKAGFLHSHCRSQWGDCAFQPWHVMEEPVDQAAAMPMDWMFPF
jgi:hypothetical protein